jgi:hypothetical protein
MAGCPVHLVNIQYVVTKKWSIFNPIMPLKIIRLNVFFKETLYINFAAFPGYYV